MSYTVFVSAFQYANKMPAGSPNILSEAAANALAIALDADYQEVCRLFYRKAQETSYRPYDSQTRKAVFQALSMEKVGDIPAVQSNYRIAYLCCAGKRAFVMKPRNGTYTALGICNPNGCIPDEIWKFDRITTRQQLRDALQLQMDCESTESSGITGTDRDTEYFCYYNPNPNGLNIGDCVVRAVSAVLHTDWTTSMEKLSESLQGEMKFNYDNNFLNVLLDAGFGRVPVQKQDGKFPTGKQVCDWLRAHYPDAEAAFAYVGKTHAAAILPDRDNGSLRFRYHDSWDSTDRKVIDLYLKKRSSGEKPEPAGQKLQASEIAAGVQICHPQFGVGDVLRVLECGSDRIITIRFGNDVTKNLTGSWILANCTSA